MENNKLFIVSTVGWDSCTIGIFSSEEKAEESIKKEIEESEDVWVSREDYWIAECVLDQRMEEPLVFQGR